MRGDLSATTAADACRTLAGDGSSGTLSIAGPDGPGAVLFDAGRVVGATSPTRRARLGDRLVGAGFLEQSDLDEVLSAQRQADGRARLGALLVERELVPHDAVRLFVQEQILDALFEVVSWRFGAFEFQDGQPTMVPEVSLAMTVDDALVEVARRQQEWHELSQVIPDLETVPTFSDQASASASLEPDEFAVLASVDGDRSVRTLAADLGYGEFELARIVYGLVLLGVVEVRLPQDAVGAALDDAFSYTPPAAPPDVDDEQALDEIGAVFDEAFAARRAVDTADEDPDPVEPEPAPEPDLDETDDPDPDDPDVDVEEPAASVPVGEAPAAPQQDAAPLPEPPPTPEPETYPPPQAVPDLPAASEDASDRADDPAADATEETRPADPASDRSSLSDVAHELRGLEGTPAARAATPAEADEPATDEPPTDEPPTDDPATDEPAADEPAADDAPADESHPEAPTPEPERPPAAQSSHAANPDADVSEFLRELSRLSVDDDAPAKPRPKRPDDTPSRDDGDDGKRKKRGIFGWGS